MAFLLSIAPIALLMFLLLIIKMKGDKSALCALSLTIAIALFAAPNISGFHLPENYGAHYILWGIVEGTLKAIFPILIVILMALYSYNVLVESGKINIIKQQFSNISGDRRIQAILIVWGFGGLLEGMAGFGSAVAIPAAILIGLGFNPIQAALLALLGNSVSTAFGAVGVPVLTLAKEVYGNDLSQIQTQILSANVILQLSLLMYILPFIILTLADLRKKFIFNNILLALAIGTLSFVAQFCAAYFLGAETPAIFGSLACIIFILIIAGKKDKQQKNAKITLKESLRAWSVYGLILFFILISSPLSGPLHKLLNQIAVSHFHLPIYPEGKAITFAWLANGGLMLFLGSFIGGLIQGISIKRLLTLLLQTLIKLKSTIITIISLVSMSAIMSYSGMIAAIAHALVLGTGNFYPLFAPLVGAIGTFATGSDTSANILFGKLQATVAEELHIDKAWLAAANTAGATGGKIISPQSIAIVAAACDQQGKEGKFLNKAMPYALLYVAITGLVVYFCDFLAL